MVDLDTLTDRLARAVVLIGWDDFIPAYAFMNLCERSGFGVKQAPALLAAFVARFPVWQEAQHGKGAEFSHLSTGHDRMAWAAFASRVLREAGIEL